MTNIQKKVVDTLEANRYGFVKEVWDEQVHENIVYLAKELGDGVRRYAHVDERGLINGQTAPAFFRFNDISK